MFANRLNRYLIAGILLVLSSCSLFDDDFEDPSPFLQYDATAGIVGPAPESLRVEVRVINQHRTDAVKLAHITCNVTASLTSQDNTILPIEPICIGFLVTSTIDAGGSKTFSLELPVEDIFKQGATAAAYEVTATIKFSQLAQTVLSAGSVILSSEED